MSLFLYSNRDFLERLRKKTRATVEDIQSAVDEAEALYKAEQEIAFKQRLRLGRSGWARGDHATPPVPQETLDALEAMSPLQYKLVSAVLEVIRSSPSSRAW